MAWTVSTYSGTAAYESSNIRTAMFELCRAVNEREAAINITKSQFYTYTGSQTADITMADLLGMNYAQAKLNLEAVQTAIVALIATGLFTESSGNSTAWTLSSIEVSLSIDLQSTPDRQLEARFWQAQKDALDAMIYVTETRAGFNGLGTLHRHIGTYGTLQGAWDVRSESTNSFAIQGVAWSMGGTTGSYFVQMGLAATYQMDFSSSNGVAVGAAYEIRERNAGLIDADYTIGSFTNTIGAGIGELTAWHEASSADITIGSITPILIDIDTAEPTTVPFTGAVQTIAAYLENFRVYIDLATILTDQS